MGGGGGSGEQPFDEEIKTIIGQKTGEDCPVVWTALAAFSACRRVQQRGMHPPHDCPVSFSFRDLQ